MRFTFFLVLSFLLVSFSLIYAQQNPSDAKSKEDKRFEAQLLNSKIFDDGRLVSTYRFTSSDGNTTNYLDINVETRVYSLSDSDFVSSLFLPVEFRISRDMKDMNFSMRDFRSGIFRAVVKDAGITVQALSYLMKKNDFQFGTFHGFEIMDITFNGASQEIIKDTVEIIFKARVSFAVGELNGNSLIKNLDPDGSIPDNVGVANPKASGAIGVRISKKIIAEIFGEIDYYAMDKNDFYVKTDDGNKEANLDGTFTRKTYGVGLKYMPSDRYNFSITGQKDSYSTRTEIRSPLLDKTKYDSKSLDPLSTMVTFEVRW